MFALSKKINTNVPIQVEAEAIRWAINLALDRCLSQLIFESDSQICINAISGDVYKSPWKIHGLILDIKDVASSFSSCVFQWSFRKANLAVHSLAVWFLKNGFVGSFDSLCGPSSFVNVISKEAFLISVL